MSIGDAPAPPGTQIIEGPRGGRYAIPNDILADIEQEFADFAGRTPEENPLARGNPNSLENLGPPGQLIREDRLWQRFGEVLWVDGEPQIFYDLVPAEDNPDGDGVIAILYPLENPDRMWRGIVENLEFREPPEDFETPSDPFNWVETHAVGEFGNTLTRFHRGIGDLPPELDLTSIAAENIKRLDEYGIKGGVNGGGTRVIKMQDGRTLFAKQYDSGSTGSGEAAAFAAGLLSEMGAHAPTSAWEPETDMFVAAAVENSRPLHAVGPDERRELVDGDSAMRAYLGGSILGNGDMHAGNLVVDDEGIVHLIDNDLSGGRDDLFDEQDEMYGAYLPNHAARVYGTFRSVLVATGWSEETTLPNREEFNALVKEMVNAIPDEKLELAVNPRTGKPNHRTEQMVANIRAARERDLWPEGYFIAINREEELIDMQMADDREAFDTKDGFWEVLE